MSKKEVSEEDIVDFFIPKKSIQDDLLATATFSMIVGSIVLIGVAPSLSQAVRFSLAVSVGSLTVSLFLLLWYNPRLETRCKLMKAAAQRRVEKAKEDIQKFTKFFYAPLFKAYLINNLQELQSKKFNSRKEFEEAIRNATDQADEDTKSTPEEKHFTVGLFYKDFLKDMYFMDEKIFHTPLDEDFSKPKHFLDIFSFRFRYHFFVVGVVSLAFSIITHLLLK
jgi:hypothetical protein